MTTKKQTKLAETSICDELNPDFIFSMTATELLSKIAMGKIDAREFAKKELKNRGLNIEGFWIGFNQPENKFNKK
jgi:hypothetical protein